jgi:hypothetical protein
MGRRGKQREESKTTGERKKSETNRYRNEEKGWKRKGEMRISVCSVCIPNFFVKKNSQKFE